MEADGVKHEDERSNKERIHQKSEKYSKVKVKRREIVSAINSRAVFIVRYGVRIISWTKMELEELDWKTKKLITMYGAHYPKADVDRLHLQRCEGRRGLIGLEDCVQVEVHSLEKDPSTSKENILKEVTHSRIIENHKYGRSKKEIYKEC